MRRFGGTKLFGNPGSTELPLFRNFPSDFRYVLGLHEGVVVGMAEGYAQATRNASFVSLHSAAGVGNAMGVIFTAYKNRTPMVDHGGPAGEVDPAVRSLPVLRQRGRAAEALCQMERRARPRRRCAPGDRSRLLHRHDAAARARIRFDPGRRLGPAGRAGPAPRRQHGAAPGAWRDRSDRRRARREREARRSSPDPR